MLSHQVNSQLVSHLQHFSTEEGLSQYTIMDMFQDSRGYLWFATWDGLSKYDGYRFHNYKVKPGDNYLMKSNRIESISEDKYKRIWMISYDGDAHCFDTRTESFWGLQSIFKNGSDAFKPSRIIINPSGKVWITSANSGCIQVSDSAYHTIIYNKSFNNIPGNEVHDILEDKYRNSWILTDKGISLVSEDDLGLRKYTFTTTDDDQYKFGINCGFEMENEIWFGSNNGYLFRFSKIKNYIISQKIASHANLIQIIGLRNQKIAIITSNQGFYILNQITNQIVHYSVSNHCGLNTDNLVSARLDKHNRLWIETNESGIYKYDDLSNKIKFFYIKTYDASTGLFPPKFILIDDIFGQTWVQPHGGGFSLYNPKTDELDPFLQNLHLGDIKISNSLHSACSDMQGNLWLCSRTNGLEKITFEKQIFNTLTINPNAKNVLSNDVRAVFEDHDQRLWIATKDMRLSVFDVNKNLIGRFSSDGQLLPDAYFGGIVYSIMQDDEGNIWLGTKGKGLFKIREKVKSHLFSVEHYTKESSDVFSLSDNSIYSIFQDKKGNIWVGTYGGGINLVRYSPDNRLYFINFRNNLKNYPRESAIRVRFINEDNHNHICVGTTGGLIIFSDNFIQPENIAFHLYTRLKGVKESLSGNDIHSIYITSSDEMYIATFGGGLNKVISYDKSGFPLAFTQYMTANGLPSDVTLAILEDEDKMLWISSETNLTKFNPSNETFETFNEVKQLLSVDNFSEASTCKTKSNELIFGYSNGIIYFSPLKIENNSFKPYISLSNFQLFNKTVQIGTQSPLNKSIDNIPKIRLTHRQNFFSIEFAALDMVDPQNVLYAYKLEGFDNDWNYVQKQRIATYTNLPKGKYVFKVKSTNSEGVWVNNERDLPIRVLPSFWETPWAYLIYILLFIGLTLTIVYILITIYHLKANVKLEKELSEMKLRFFTDVSHEIRTPLTLITAPVEHLMTDKNTPEPIKKQLKVISQNSGRLLRLVNQILDYRKIQFTHLQVTEIDIAYNVQEICDNFSEIANTQHIHFEYINQSNNSRAWVDSDCLEKIVMNLLSNAFKFTPSGKAITVTVSADDEFVTISVRDQGIGVAREKQKKLFTRFASFNEDKSKPSTGIGLSMVKDLVDKHGAKLTIESEVGKGSTFSVSFKRGTSHFDKTVEIIASQTVGINSEINSNAEMDETLSSDESNIIVSRKLKPNILVVEDDDDLRIFIKGILENEYGIIEATDGQIGIEKAQKFCPDFIVSDIMMPNVDGIELLKKVKNDLRTSHIPVVLLTSKTTIESKLEGLTYGADDYITKPFSVAYFQARIANLLQQRIQLQEIFRSKLVVGQKIDFLATPVTITSHDEDMMKKVMNMIDENIENSDFVIEDMAQYVGMSRSVFFKKMKSLTGLAPVEFVRDVKMKRAA